MERNHTADSASHSFSASPDGAESSAVQAEQFVLRAEPFDPGAEKISLFCRMMGYDINLQQTFDEAELGGSGSSSISGNPISIANANGKICYHPGSFIDQWVEQRKFSLLPKSAPNKLLAHIMDFYAEELLTPLLRYYRFGHELGEKDIRKRLNSIADKRMDQLCWLNRQKRQLKLYGIHDHMGAAIISHSKRLLSHLDKQVRTHKYLSGSIPGMIDISFYGPIYSYLYSHQVYRNDLEKSFPALVNWIQNLECIGMLVDEPKDFASLPDSMMHILSIINRDWSCLIQAHIVAYQNWLKEMGNEAYNLPAYLGMCCGTFMQHNITRVISVNFLWHMQRITQQIKQLENKDKKISDTILKFTGMEFLNDQIPLFSNRKIIFDDDMVCLEYQS